MTPAQVNEASDLLVRLKFLDERLLDWQGLSTNRFTARGHYTTGYTSEYLFEGDEAYAFVKLVVETLTAQRTRIANALIALGIKIT